MQLTITYEIFGAAAAFHFLSLYLVSPLKSPVKALSQPYKSPLTLHDTSFRGPLCRTVLAGGQERQAPLTQPSGNVEGNLICFIIVIVRQAGRRACLFIGTIRVVVVGTYAYMEKGVSLSLALSLSLARYCMYVCMYMYMGGCQNYGPFLGP